MHFEIKAFATIVVVLLVFSLALASMAAGAGSITLPSTAQAPGGIFPISGTGFNSTKAVGMGFGAEVAGSNTDMAYNGTSDGLTWSGRLSNYPIKPGSFVLTSDTTSGAGLVSTYTDDGDGTTTGTFEGAVGTINYVTGEWSRTTTVDVSGIAANYSATYIRYQYNVTPAVGITTDALGSFSASIIVPSVGSGTYNVTAIDTAGNRANGSLSVDVAIPEGLTIGVVVLLTSVAALVGTRFFRKRARFESWN